MEVHRCMGCMEPVTEYPCPYCGYTEQNRNESGYALPAGRILDGKYLVGKALGQGGFGITYIGFDLALERKVAIKEYFPTTSASRQSSKSSNLMWVSPGKRDETRKEAVQYVLKEARKMAKVDSIPAIVSVRDAFEENNTAYIVMDFIEGETLKKYIQRKGPMSWEEVKEKFIPVLAALEQVHRAGLIHRDISPDNLMISPDGMIKVLDLGAAKDSSGEDDMSGDVVKSGFSPFELYTRNGTTGTWSDVYSLAATMLFALTGVVPRNALERMSGVEIDWTMPQLRNVPQTVKEVLRKAMEIQVQNRTQTVEQLRQQLTEAKGKKRGISWKITAAAVLCASAFLVLLIGILGGKDDEPEKAASRSDILSPAEPRLVQIVCEPVGGERYVSSSYDYTFNEAGYLTVSQETQYDENGEMESSSCSYYDGSKEENRTKYEFTSYYEGEMSYVSTSLYDKNGVRTNYNYTSYTDGEVYYAEVGTCDSYGNLLRNECAYYYKGQKTDDAYVEDYTLEYDEYQNLILSRTENGESGTEDRYAYTYSPDGRMLTEQHEYRYWDAYSDVTFNYYYEYDEDENVTSSWFYPLTEGVFEYTEERTDTIRREDGNILERKVYWDGELVETYTYEWDYVN